MALLEFRSKCAGGFFLMPETFQEICKVVRCPYSERGCWPPNELKQILELLEEEVAREKKQKALGDEEFRKRELAGRGSSSFDVEEERQRRDNYVSFGMRTFPLREMIRESIKKQVPVMWGIP